MKSQNLSVFTIFSVDILTMADQGAFDHKYFITLALQNKMPWNALPFIIEGLTQTLEKSKEVNKFLLQELEKSHTKIQSLEGLIVSKSSANENTDKNSAKSDIFNSLDVVCEVAKLKRSGSRDDEISSKSIASKCTSENEFPLSILESKINEIQTTKEILQEVNSFDHETFAFESELKIKTEIKTETAEGTENQKPDINLNQKLKTEVNVKKELKSFNCNSCGKSFKNSALLKRHIVVHRECKLCDKKFARKNALVEHEIVFHQANPNIKCNFCNKTFKTFSLLKIHKRTHGEFKCKFCDKKFVRKWSLTYHERVSHDKTPFLKCTFCDGLFMSSNALESHLKSHE